MKRSVRIACGLAFIALCAGVFTFLRLFTQAEWPMQYLAWDYSARVLEGGAEAPFDAGNTDKSDNGAGEYVFTLILPEGLTDGHLLFETSGLDISLNLDGAEIYSSSVFSDAEALNLAQASVPLPDDCAGKTLRLLCRQTGGNSMFPPLMRYVRDSAVETDTIAYANLTGIPAGAYAVAFVLVCGLFLLGAARKKADCSLVPLALAALGLMSHPISTAYGNQFLPGGVSSLLARFEIYPVVLVMMAAYLLMNRRRDFWRIFGRCSLVSACALGVMYLISLARGSYLASYLNFAVPNLFLHGEYEGLCGYAAFWLVVMCALISAYGLIRAMAAADADAQAMSMREQLALESYRAMERKLRESAAQRHEARHQLTALCAIYRGGDMEKLGAELERFADMSAANLPYTYTPNFTLNAILQNAAMQAADNGVRFDAVALTPEKMPIPEVDLCGFIMNLLDNACEAAGQCQSAEKRYIVFRGELKGNFLAIRCENGCEGNVRLDEKGWPISTKPAPEGHGFGMRQMREISTKYGSILDFTCIDGVFTVQTALCLKRS